MKNKIALEIAKWSTTIHNPILLFTLIKDICYTIRYPATNGLPIN